MKNKLFGILTSILLLTCNYAKSDTIFSVKSGTNLVGQLTIFDNLQLTNYFTNIVYSYSTNFINTTNFVNQTNIVYITNYNNGNTNFPSSIVLEAESGTVSSPFSVISGYVSQSIQTTTLTGGKLTINFNILSAGSYILILNVDAPTESNNSIFLAIDSTPSLTDIFDIPVTSGFQNRTASIRGNGTSALNQFVPMIYSLSAGNHILNIYGRESLVKIDSITIVKQ